MEETAYRTDYACPSCKVSPSHRKKRYGMDHKPNCSYFGRMRDSFPALVQRIELERAY